MAEENSTQLSWEDVGRRLDAHNNLVGDLLGGDATSLARSIVNDILDDATVTEELAVTVRAVRAHLIC